MIKPIRHFNQSVLEIWKHEIKPLFNLKLDLDEAGTIESVTKAIEFKGASVWSLFFAILIASIGLNVNSTAVIIGAMLISPLMGPIVGAGVALGINHFSLLKTAIRNLFIATLVGIVTSFLYFLLSPLSEAQSELLARTQPTIYDVLIAICGGATGIISSTRKERALHALSGVAIATALMPPLCTAGYSLAHGQSQYFIGAFYLYAINSIYICIATFVVVRALRFHKVSLVDSKTERRVGLYMFLFGILVAIPSVYTAYQTVSDVVFSSKANRFLQENFHYPATRIFEKKLRRQKEGNLIEIITIGKTIDAQEQNQLRNKLESYGLKGTSLTLVEAGRGSYSEIEARLKTELLEKFHHKDESNIKLQEDKIRLLEEELTQYKKGSLLVTDIGREVQVLFPNVSTLSMGRVTYWDGAITGERETVFIRWKSKPRILERDSLEKFLRTRLKDQTTDFFHDAK